MTLFDDEMMKALEADGEYLRQMTGEDHGPYFLGVGHRTMNEELEDHLANMAGLWAKSDSEKQLLLGRVEELETKLAKALTELKMLIDVSTLMQSSAAYDKRRHQNIITDTVWGQWAKQLKFARTTLEELRGPMKGQGDE